MKEHYAGTAVTMKLQQVEESVFILTGFSIEVWNNPGISKLYFKPKQKYSNLAE